MSIGFIESLWFDFLTLLLFSADWPDRFFGFQCRDFLMLTVLRVNRLEKIIVFHRPECLKLAVFWPICFINILRITGSILKLLAFRVIGFIDSLGLSGFIA